MREVAWAAALAAGLAGPALGQADTVPTRTANDGQVILSGVPPIPPALSARLAPYGDIRSAALADVGPDAVYLLTRFGSTSQLHRVRFPGGDRTQLTFGETAVTGAWLRPSRPQMLLQVDSGGAEFYQLELLDLASLARRRLGDGRSRYTAPRFSRDGRWLAFTSTRRDGRANDVWLLDLESADTATLLFAAPDGWNYSALDWDRVGRRLLVQQYRSIADARLFLVDRATGRAEPLLGDDAHPATYSDAWFDAEERGLFLLTDAFGEFVRPAYFDLARRRLEPIPWDVPGDVETLVLAPDRRRGAVVVNVEGMSRLYLFDPATRRFAPVGGLPDGVIGAVRFRPDGGALALSLSGPTLPGDVFVVPLGASPLEAGAPERWTESETGGLDPRGFVAPQLVRYRSFDGRSIPAFVYRPRRAGPHPVVVLLHGGPESQFRPSFNALVQSWVNELGVAVVAPNVRGSAGYGKTYLALDNGRRREDAVRDVGALLDWVATQPDLDAGRVVVYGGSYGGYMVLASLVHYSDRLRGGLDLVGISHFVTFLRSTQGYRRDLRRAEYGDERDPAMRAFLEAISPLTNAHRIRAPLVVVQGANDPRVPPSEAEQIVRAVRANGMPVWYVLARNEGHGFARRENQELLRDVVALFLLDRFGLPVPSSEGTGW